MKGRDFVITSLQPWDINIGSTIKNTALEISNQNRVLYINTPMDVSSRLKGDKNNAMYKQRMDVIKHRKPYIRKIKENLWVADCPFMIMSINFIPTSVLFDFFNLQNNKKIASLILKAVAELGFKNFIHLIDTDIYRSQYLKELIKPAVSVYYCRDFVIGFPYWKKNGTRLEPKIAAKADVVITNSTKFAIRFREYNKNTNPIETGVNLKLYDSSQTWNIPEDIKPLPRPIVGYVGTLIDSRLDIELLYNLAKECPQYSFVFVGPEMENFPTHPIHNVKNAYFLGGKPVETLPSYITSFDVCMNPQIINDITDGNYPLKIDEYLAMGKPTIATSTHTMRDVFKDHVHLATDIESYKEAIVKALKEEGDEPLRLERIRFAHTHSWTNSVKKIYNAINTWENKK